MAEISIERGYIPGAIGRVAELHGVYYHEHWGFDLFFEAKVASELSDFLMRHDTERDGFWIARSGSLIEGSISIDGLHAETEGAHLRWFIVSDAARGRGAGGRLITEAIDFCRDKGYPSIYLWTFGGLEPARHLYEKHGFELVEQRQGSQWGREVLEQRFELRL